MYLSLNFHYVTFLMFLHSPLQFDQMAMREKDKLTLIQTSTVTLHAW